MVPPAAAPSPGPRALQACLVDAWLDTAGRSLAEHALDPAFARRARDADALREAWRSLPPALAAAGDPRLAFAFSLACLWLGLDLAQGLALARAARAPDRWMRLFLADHGLVRYDAFEVAPARASITARADPDVMRVPG